MPWSDATWKMDPAECSSYRTRPVRVPSPMLRMWKKLHESYNQENVGPRCRRNSWSSLSDAKNQDYFLCKNLQEGDNISTLTDQAFHADIDVQQFEPDEVTVTLKDGNLLIIEGKHEEKEDEHGTISRHFVRRYILPKDCDTKKLQSKLTTDGVLTIVAPVFKPEENRNGYTEIPILQTGLPAEPRRQKGSKPIAIAVCEKDVEQKK